jgi:hypothetical protein
LPSSYTENGSSNNPDSLGLWAGECVTKVAVITMQVEDQTWDPGKKEKRKVIRL